MTITVGTQSKPGDTRLKRYQRILQALQNLPGSLAHNNVSNNDTIRTTMVKILRSKLGV